MQIIRVVCGIIQKTDANDGRLLILKRALGRSYAGLWEFPGGKIEADESIEQALKREIQEEIGVDVGETVYIGSASAVAEDKIIELHGVMTTVALDPQKYFDHTEHKWVSFEELAQYPMPPADYGLLEALGRHLNGQGSGQKFALGGGMPSTSESKGESVASDSAPFAPEGAKLKSPLTGNSVAYELAAIDPVRLGKIYGSLNGLLGIAVAFFLVFLQTGPLGGMGLLTFAPRWILVVAIPVGNFCLGWIFGVALALLYNVVAFAIGGVKVRLEK